MIRSGDRYLPCRQCAGCGAKRPRSELIRVAVSPDGILTADAAGKMPGRGAYLCRDKGCLEKALARKSFSRILRLKSSVSGETAEELRKQITEMIDHE